jgi:hypothetical protein
VNAISELTQTTIAFVAKQSTYHACKWIMVNTQLLTRCVFFFTDSARMILFD